MCKDTNHERVKNLVDSLQKEVQSHQRATQPFVDLLKEVAELAIEAERTITAENADSPESKEKLHEMAHGLSEIKACLEMLEYYVKSLKQDYENTRRFVDRGNEMISKFENMGDSKWYEFWK